MRLIDADALIAEYDRVHVGEPGNARKLIENAPTIEERKTGKWILHTYMPHHNYCSNCECDSPYNKRWKYCPHCGASMMEGEQP